MDFTARHVLSGPSTPARMRPSTLSIMTGICLRPTFFSFFPSGLVDLSYHGLLNACQAVRSAEVSASISGFPTITASRMFLAAPHDGFQLAAGLLQTLGELLARPVPVGVFQGKSVVVDDAREYLTDGPGLVFL